MPNPDATKEEIGYLKIAFGILLVTDISLISWFFTNISTLTAFFSMAALAAVVSLSGIIFRIHRRIERLIADLRRL